ncbi:hypothetical protein B0T21DRAFT_404511 [Apiosordaria backusii]|uniref:Heterokaryon incompatibility domain-containing protein n=1 Tax=Apiosordaria backusii TaxID=314023 RepID=A0AA40AIU3_9PEZI|nr:hypothetical protein B0T21DRAFT_404511 [Apiosordaria backusii]
MRTTSAHITWSSKTLSSIRAWLHTCHVSHANQCIKSRSSRRLPRRLIDICRNVCIVSTDNLSPNTQYLTLSHRWGDPPSILLTSRTSFLLDSDISTHLSNCKEAAVFRHAIHVTRGLGFRYIWIDALCIMQDNACLIFDRKPFSISPLRATVTVPTTQRSMTLKAFSPECRVLQGPLYNRGWVFQERSLAPQASEVLLSGIASQRHRRLGMATTDLSEMRKDNGQARWRYILQEYSHTSVTFVDDRLRAISAVAKLFGSAMQLDPSDYLAGLWKDSVPLSLLWWQDANGKRHDPKTGIATETDTAPSWSWASVMGSVAITDPPFVTSTTAKVLDVHIVRASQNLFDGVESCHLRLRGHVCKFRRVIEDGTPYIKISEYAKFPELNEHGPGDGFFIQWDISRAVVEDLLGSITYEGSNSPTYCLLHIARNQDMVNTSMEEGIVLQRASSRGGYLRVGYFCLPYPQRLAGTELEAALNGGLGTLEFHDRGLDRKPTSEPTGDSSRKSPKSKSTTFTSPSTSRFIILSPFHAMSNPPSGRSRSRSPSHHKPRSHRPHPHPCRAIRPLLLLVALVNLSWSLYQLPVARVIESRLCHDHYSLSDPSVILPDGTVPEELCKLDEIQQRLGKLQGVMETVWVGGDFLMTIPLVTLADRYGYGFVLTLNLLPRAFLLGWTLVVGYFGGMLRLPVEWVVMAPGGSWLGGDCVFNSVVYFLISELTEDHVLRATFFAYLNATTSIFSSQLGPALASFTMSFRLWLPFVLGLALLLLSAP